MGSRYVGQLGCYVGQSRYELARIETYEVAMQASQGGYPHPFEVAMCTPF